MILLVGHQKNIIQMTYNLLVGKSKLVRLQFRKMLRLHSLALCGMKHLVIIMMLLLGSIMMEIQVCVMFDFNLYMF